MRRPEKQRRFAVTVAFLAAAFMILGCKPKVITKMKDQHETGDKALFPLTEADKI
jgi:hypothetical protein